MARTGLGRTGTAPQLTGPRLRVSQIWNGEVMEERQFFEPTDVALGPQDVLNMVVGRGLRLAGLGVAIGLAASLVLTRLMQGVLYGVTPTDPVTFGGVALALLGVAAFASWLPALRATRVDPLVALRSE
jgi:hypothetical protein